MATGRATGIARRPQSAPPTSTGLSSTAKKGQTATTEMTPARSVPTKQQHETRPSPALLPTAQVHGVVPPAQEHEPLLHNCVHAELITTSAKAVVQPVAKEADAYELPTLTDAEKKRRKRQRQKEAKQAAAAAAAEAAAAEAAKDDVDSILASLGLPTKPGCCAFGASEGKQCSTKVAVIGHVCAHCKLKFCLAHAHAQK